MNSRKVEQYIKSQLNDRKQFYPRKIFTGLSVDIYSGSFGSIQIRIASDWGYVFAYVGNYSTIDEKISDFLHNASFNLYEAFYRHHHRKRVRG